MKILFMCVANSARSQLAEGMARKLFDRGVRVESAGSKPAQVNPLAVRAMGEVGVDILAHRSKSIEELPDGFMDGLSYVITLCAEEVCPAAVTGAKRLHWPLPDPASQPGTEEQRLQRFREVRDELAKRLKSFAAEAGIPLASGA